MGDFPSVRIVGQSPPEYVDYNAFTPGSPEANEVEARRLLRKAATELDVYHGIEDPFTLLAEVATAMAVSAGEQAEEGEDSE